MYIKINSVLLATLCISSTLFTMQEDTKQTSNIPTLCQLILLQHRNHLEKAYVSATNQDGKVTYKRFRKVIVNGPEYRTLSDTWNAVEQTRNFQNKYKIPGTPGREDIESTSLYRFIIDRSCPRIDYDNMTWKKLQNYTTVVNIIIGSGSELRSLPYNFARLINLTYLNLNSNQFSSHTSSTFPKLSPNIQTLLLSRNGFETIPTTIFDLRNLKILNVSQNRLAELSKKIRNLTNLVELNLSFNNLEVIPKEISCLTNLKKLYLHSNRIACLPRTANKIPWNNIGTQRIIRSQGSTIKYSS